MEQLREAKKQKHMLHCPKCWKVQPHTRKVRSCSEIFVCQKCGTEQSYALSKDDEECDE